MKVLNGCNLEIFRLYYFNEVESDVKKMFTRNAYNNYTMNRFS